MILWLNGAFGAGKTQTAFELQRRLPRAFVYDPENLGYWIRACLPPALHRPDFQDHPQWRAGNFALLDELASSWDGVILVPMTITNPQYYQQLIVRLSERHALRHCILLAGRKTLLRRLRHRLEGPRSWAAQQIDRCLTAFETDIPGLQVDTEGRSIPTVAEQVAALAGLSLLPDSRSRPRRALDRLLVQLRHIR